MAEANPQQEREQPQSSSQSKPLEFKKGQIMYSEEPYGAVLSSDKIGSRCSCCFRFIPPGEPLTPCERCSRVIYCSPECFKADKLDHGTECEMMILYEDLPGEQHRLIYRVMSRSMNEKSTKQETRVHFFDHERTISNLISHLRDANELTVETARGNAQTIKLKMDHAYRSDIPADDLLETMFKIRVNSFQIYDSTSWENVRIGTGFYLGASTMDHTCDRIDDYVLSFAGRKLVLTALTNFSVGSALDIKRNYIHPNLSAQRRRHELSFKYYFFCDCARCALEAGTDELNLPEGLDDFDVTKPSRGEWESRAKGYYEVAQHFPPRNYHRFNLALHLQKLCSTAQDYNGAVRYGLGALAGCMTFEDKKQIIYLLCRDMVKLGFSEPSHRGNAAFESLRSQGIILLGMTIGREHRLVKDLKRLVSRSDQSSRSSSSPDASQE